MNTAKSLENKLITFRKNLLNTKYDLLKLSSDMNNIVTYFDDSGLNYLDNNDIIFPNCLEVRKQNDDKSKYGVFTSINKPFICDNKAFDIHGKNKFSLMILSSEAINSKYEENYNTILDKPILESLTHLDLAEMFNHFIWQAFSTRFINQPANEKHGLSKDKVKKLEFTNKELDRYSNEKNHSILPF